MLKIHHFQQKEKKKKTARKAMNYQISPTLIHSYKRPKPFRFILDIPRNIGGFAKQSFQKKNWHKIAILTTGTALFTTIDQPLLDGVQDFSKSINLDTDRSVKTLINFKIAGLDAPLEVPDSFSSGIYDLRENWSSLFLTAGIYSYGLIKI